MPDQKRRIDTPEEYSEAVAEVQRLQTAREGGAAFRRRQALRAALQDYEQRQQPGNITPAAPIDPVPA